jgi:plasmid stabilization system protein ParE
VTRYDVILLPEARKALAETARYISEQDGPARAAHWLRKLIDGTKSLEAIPRGFPEVGIWNGKALHSKLVMSHRLYYFIDDAEKNVAVIDVVHTARQTRREAYEGDV